jgi:hypothetical protein
MTKDEFLKEISTMDREQLNKLLHEKTKPIKLIYPVVRVARKKNHDD